MHILVGTLSTDFDMNIVYNLCVYLFHEFIIINNKPILTKVYNMRNNKWTKLNIERNKWVSVKELP